MQSSSLSLQDVLNTHSEVFENELGTLRGTTAQIYVDPEAMPKFYQARPVPYAIRGRLDQELNSLGIITPVEFSKWAASVVPVVKRDRNIQICGDYKLTVNRVAKVDSYPLP